MSNYSTLERNVLSHLDENGREAFMWARERLADDRHAYKAEAFAVEAQSLVGVLGVLIPLAAKKFPADLIKAAPDRYQDDLMQFIMTRHACHRFPGSKKGWSLAGGL